MSAPPPPEVVYRRAGPSDALDVAHLHADSWRAHYRGAYSDSFLDGDVVDDRVAFWTERLASEDEHRFTLVARSPEPLSGSPTRLWAQTRSGALCWRTCTSPARPTAGVSAGG